MEVVFVTTNKGKIASLSNYLNPHGVHVVQHALDLPEPRSNDVQEIALHKARFAYQALQKPLVALDAGFYVDSLGGFPRAYVNFMLETIGVDGLLKLAQGTDRKCEFQECLVYTDGDITEKFLAPVKGKLATEKRGVLQPHHWSPLALVFVPDGFDKTLAEFEPDEYKDFHASLGKNSWGAQFTAWYVNRSN